MKLFYRLNQLWHNVTAQPLSPQELEQIELVLSPGEVALFQRMLASDQRHAFRVYGLIKECGHTDNDLLAAALLHDVGKVRATLSAWDRSLAVLGETFFPRKVKEWAADETSGWKRTFVVREQHAAWGAALAENAGSRLEVINLILRHQDPLPANGSRNDERLALLQWADGQN